MDLDSIRSRIAAHGLAFRGAFHPDGADLAPAGTGTILLVGFTGGDQWPVFAASAEAGDGLPDPLDRWSRRVATEIAASVGAEPLFPFGGPPFLPFQRWAQKAEPVHPSPLGILIHPDWGLWHAYRGALAFAERLKLPPPKIRPRPCDSCADKPCLTACPVGAFTNPGYDVPACVAHISTEAGRDCMEIGCRARLACPVGAAHRYRLGQARFHSTAFLAAQKPIPPV
jgi:ferredoxin